MLPYKMLQDKRARFLWYTVTVTASADLKTAQSLAEGLSIRILETFSKTEIQRQARLR